MSGATEAPSSASFSAADVQPESAPASGGSGESLSPVSPLPGATPDLSQPAAGAATPGATPAAAAPARAPYIPTEEEIKAEVERIRSQQQQQPFDYNQFTTAQANALREALAPILPKPPAEKMPWDDDAIFSDTKAFRSAWDARDKQVEQRFQQQYINPLVQAVTQIQKLIPMIYASRAENPVFNQVQSRANEIYGEYKQHGMTYQGAMAMAQKEVAKNGMPKTNVRPVPAHASAPDTKAETFETPKEAGEAKMGDIIKELRASGKF